MGSKPILCQIGADLMFLFKGLSLVIRRLSFNSNRIFLFSLVRTLKFSKDGVWLQSNKWSLTSTTLGLNFLLSEWWDSDMSSNSYIKVFYTFPIIGFIAESTLKFIDNTRLSSLGIWSLKRKAFANLFWLLNTICNLKQLRMPLRDSLIWF